jgi:hypothetical protein
MGLLADVTCWGFALIKADCELNPPERPANPRRRRCRSAITIVSQGQLMGVSIVSEVNARLGRARHVIRCVCCTCNRLLANGQIHTMGKGSSCWKLEEWTYTHTHIHIIYPPLYVCIWVMVHIRTCVVCMCYGRVCLVTLAPRCVANYTPAAHTHTPQPLFHPLCTICTATTATKKQLDRKSQSDGQVFDLQVGRTLVLVRVHMSLFDNLLVICDFVALKADCERWMP